MQAYFILSEWLLFNAKWAIVQLYNDENKLHFNDEMDIEIRSNSLVNL